MHVSCLYMNNDASGLLQVKPSFNKKNLVVETKLLELALSRKEPFLDNIHELGNVHQ